jgi:hypothetical protein
MKDILKALLVACVRSLFPRARDYQAKRIKSVKWLMPMDTNRN